MHKRVEVPLVTISSDAFSSVEMRVRRLLRPMVPWRGKCLSVTRTRPAKTAERIEVIFGVEILMAKGRLDWVLITSRRVEGNSMRFVANLL